MEDLNDKITGDNLKAAEFVQPMSELQNIIENTGQTLTNTDLNQTGKGVAQYVANGNFYTDSGSGNAYVLTQIGLKQITASYVDGMAIEFIPSNTNTGSATVTVAGLGIRPISDTASGGEIQSGTRITMRHNISSSEFEIFQTAAAPVTAGSMYGLNLSNAAADANNDITIAVGECANKTNSVLLKLSSAITKQLDAAWVAGNNVGGLFSGSKSANTWYHVFLIRKDSDGSIDAGFDTSISAANIPSGYTSYKWIGSVLADGIGDIVGFIQRGDEIILKSPILEYSGGASTTKVDLTISTPLDVEVLAHMNVFAVTDTSVYFHSPDVDDLVPSTTVSPLASQSAGSATNVTGAGQVTCFTNTLSQVSHRSTNTGTLRIVTFGWAVERGAV